MATAATPVAGNAAPNTGNKKLIIILVGLLLLALAGGGAAVVVMKNKAAAAAAAAEDDDGEARAPVAEKRRDHAKSPPTFVALEPFVVNLADKETDRFAQVGITLEVEDAAFAEEIKAYMPAIRNGILMVLAHKTSAQLLSREGKVALAREIMREAVLPLGIDVGGADNGDDEEDRPRKRKKAAVHNPVKHVHFSNFIVQ